MDLDKILHFVPSHIEQIIAVLGVLFLVTTILLLVRSLKERPEDSGNNVDVGAIEGALKRVLAQNPQPAAQNAAGAGENASVIADLAPLKNALVEKEKQLSQLNAELTEAKAAAAAAALSGSAALSGGEGEGGSAAVAGLELEISDLKARLAEYEIIEDDIADLALYKEENARLKREIEEARTSGAQVEITAPPIIEANPAAGIPGLTEALQEEAAAAPVAQAPAPTPAVAPPAQVEAAAPAPAPAAAPEPATPELDPLAHLLASAEASAPADSLGAPDTEKMLSEAESLASSSPGSDDPEINALSDLLDTDKLLEEVNSLDAQDVMSEFKDKSKLG